jgi:two-component system CheB/CheR fusion protein
MAKRKKQKAAKKAERRPRPPRAPANRDPPAAAEATQTGFPVVGIGASAGGLDAFKRLFAKMPAKNGMAFVLIPHLDPTHESLMVELLARHSALPIVEAREGTAVKPDQVYVIPPNKYLAISGGVLRLTGPVERSQTTIDYFLRSLADDQQERAICIILSGTGGHGTLGLKAIKAAGGMAMVQDPATAEHPRMPESAIATGLADYVLPAEEMPQALIKYVEHFYGNGGAQVKDVDAVSDELSRILALLRARTKHDFRCYRKKMLLRRVERRMGLNHIEHLKDYLNHLRHGPDEIKQLAKDLLISVTSFFRDPESFRMLETHAVVPLVQARDAHESLRVWVPGCATGEEAYSIAMLFSEQLNLAQKSCRLQVFATDVDESAMEVARHGIYPESILGDLQPARLARFFTKAGEQAYQVNKQLRETVVFAVQNLITDAPFSKLDLISCRNLLIYLDPEIQKKVVALFHFALNEGGYLMLGPSETIGRQTDLSRRCPRNGASIAGRQGYVPPASISPFWPAPPPRPGPGPRPNRRPASPSTLPSSPSVSCSTSLLRPRCSSIATTIFCTSLARPCATWTSRPGGRRRT